LIVSESLLPSDDQLVGAARLKGDEVGVDQLSGGGVVFANPRPPHEEVVARDRQPVGCVAKPRDQGGVNRDSRCGVEFTNRASTCWDVVAHVKVVIRHRECLSGSCIKLVALEDNEVGANGARGNVAFANRVPNYNVVPSKEEGVA